MHTLSLSLSHATVQITGHWEPHMGIGARRKRAQHAPTGGLVMTKVRPTHAVVSNHARFCVRLSLDMARSRASVRPQAHGMVAHTSLPFEGSIRWGKIKILGHEHNSIPILPPIAVRPGQARKLLLRRLLLMSSKTKKLRLSMALEVLGIEIRHALHRPAAKHVQWRRRVEAGLVCAEQVGNV